MTRLQRVVIGLAVALFLAVVTVGPYLAVYFSVRNDHLLGELRADQATAEQALQSRRQLSQLELQLLQELKNVTGQPAQQSQAAKITRLMTCLYNRIDYDTGHGALDPSCSPAQLDLPPPPPRSSSPATSGSLSDGGSVPVSASAEQTPTATTTPSTTALRNMRGGRHENRAGSPAG